MSAITVKIVTPEGVYKEFDATIVNIQTLDGDRGILPEHMPLVTMLKIGQLSTEESTGRETYAIAGGLFYFRNNKAEIMTDAIENKKDIDESRAQDAADRANKRLDSSDPSIDIKRAELALKKAMNRLEVVGLK